MKIVYSILGTFNSGGMERVLANKANYLAKVGYDITIVTTDQKNRDAYFEFDQRIKHIDLGINYTDDIHKNIFPRGFLYIKKRIKHKHRLKNILFQIRPDISISMFDNDASFITEIGDGSKKVLEIHFSRFKRLQYGRGGIWKIIDSCRNKSDLHTVKKFDRFVVLTEEDKGYWGKLDNIEVIPNSNSFFIDQQASLEKKQVLAIGRFDYQKGFDDLIRIWEGIQQTHPDWKLNIFGHGPLESNFKDLIASLQLESSVNLYPPTKNIESIYLDHSILVMTSRYEGLPMVLLEAQVCGLPMVAYACKCGPKDIIVSEENGYLVDQGDQEDFAVKLKILMDNENLRKEFGQTSLKNSVKFSEENIMKKWMKLFDKLMVN